MAVVSLSCNCCCCHSSRCFILVSWEDKCSLVQQWIWWWSADWWFHIYMSLWRNARAPQNVMLLMFIQALQWISYSEMWFFQEIVTCTCFKSYSSKLNMFCQIQLSTLVLLLSTIFFFLFKSSNIFTWVLSGSWCSVS